MVDRDIYFAVVGDVHGDIYISNEYARLLIEALQPKLVVFGHMHFRYTCSLTTVNRIVSNIFCLANVKKGKEAIAIFRLTTDKQIIEVTD